MPVNLRHVISRTQAVHNAHPALNERYALEGGTSSPDSPLVHGGQRASYLVVAPDNGTEYKLMLIECMDNKNTLVALLTHGTCCVFGSAPAPCYVAEKLRLPDNDAAFLAWLLGWPDKPSWLQIQGTAQVVCANSGREWTVDINDQGGWAG